MDKVYTRIIWVNQPSTTTALGATNLNKMDSALNTIDDRVITLDTTKANQSTVNGVVQSITYNDATGVLTITKVNGTSTTIDTKLEKLAVNFSYNPTTQQLDITLDDGTVQHVDMSALVTQYEFLDTDTVSFSVQPDGKIKANIINGSITADKLQPNYLADIIVQANIATTQAGVATDAAEDAIAAKVAAEAAAAEAEAIAGFDPTDYYNKTDINTIVGDRSLLPTPNADLVGAVNEASGDFYEGKNFKANNPYRYGGALTAIIQLHCHTANSDGADTPTALVTAYKNVGYDGITITDHNVLTSDPGVTGIVWLGASSEESQGRHINAYDISVLSSSLGLLNAQDIINLHRANNKMTVLNHINWNWTDSIMTKAMEYDELATLYDYNFIEVWNGVTGTNAEKQWDWALSSGKKVFGTATDDCHSISGVSSFTGLPQFNQGWVVVHTNIKDKFNILDNLRKGNFYASNGNDITVTVTGNIITASSTASSNFKFIGRNGRTLLTANGATSASYTINGDEMYIRVVSTRVSDSKVAWSQPIFLDCIGDDGRQQGDIKIPLTGIYRQAIMNSNYDIWTYGTSITNPASLTCLADRWKIAYTNSGTLPTIVHSKQQITPGEVDRSKWCYRVNVNGAGSGFGAGDVYNISQYIENGTSLLCGWGKKVTLSFYARSNISGKRIGVNLEQQYGTGGSPSAAEVIKGTAFTLSSHWTKYEFTFTTNLLTGKTFGTDNNDTLRVKFYYMWGLTVATGQIGAVTAETFVGAGDIDVAQVQLCAGDKAYQFNPKTALEELRDCRRYVRLGSLANYCFLSDASQIGFNADFSDMRVAPAVKNKGIWYFHSAGESSPVALADGTTFDISMGYSGAGATLSGINDGVMYQINDSSIAGNKISNPVYYIANADY